jgi:hypothetical protein
MREWLSREWLSKIGRLLHLRRGLDDDLSEEMYSHLDFLTEENMARGMLPAEARAAARRQFGNETAAQSYVGQDYTQRGLRPLALRSAPLLPGARHAGSKAWCLAFPPKIQG